MPNAKKISRQRNSDIFNKTPRPGATRRIVRHIFIGHVVCNDGEIKKRSLHTYMRGATEPLFTEAKYS